MKILALFSLACVLCGCTYSIHLIHTEGVAEDVVDETQAPSTNLSAALDKLLK